MMQPRFRRQIHAEPLKLKRLQFEFSLRCIVGALTCRSQEINAVTNQFFSPPHRILFLLLSVFFLFTLALLFLVSLHHNPCPSLTAPSPASFHFAFPCVSLLPLSALQRLSLYPNHIWCVLFPGFYPTSPLSLISLSVNACVFLLI